MCGDHEILVLLAAVVAGMCAGALNAWSWLLVMPPEHRDAFLRGVVDGCSPLFWWRKATRR